MHINTSSDQLTCVKQHYLCIELLLHIVIFPSMKIQYSDGVLEDSIRPFLTPAKIIDVLKIISGEFFLIQKISDDADVFARGSMLSDIPQFQSVVIVILIEIRKILIAHNPPVELWCYCSSQMSQI